MLRINVDLPLVIEFFDEPPAAEAAIHFLEPMVAQGHIISWPANAMARPFRLRARLSSTARETNGAGSCARGAHALRSPALFADSGCFCAASGQRSTRCRPRSLGWRRPTQLPAADCSAQRRPEARARERGRR
jgi:hypothetical protein